MIHFWELPENRNYILLKEDFKNNIIENLKDKNLLNRQFRKIKNQKIRIKTIKNIVNLLNLDLDLVERNIVWIGGSNSKGLHNPILPINIKGRAFARFIAGIMNDGCLTKENKNSYGRLMYDNFDKTLRGSIIKDYLTCFGGNIKEIPFRDYKDKKFLEFTSIMRDIVFIIMKKKGSKADNNIELPDFIFNGTENMLGWIEQTIADEGEVKYEPEKYRRSIIWRRSFDVTNLFKSSISEEIPLGKLPNKIKSEIFNQKFNLFESELKILNILGIKYKTYNLGVYPTEKGKIRTRWQINITKRNNLIKLRNLIKIPSQDKDEKFTQMCNGFQRYKEPLKIRETIIELCKSNGKINSIELKMKMNYKNLGTSTNWLKRFEKEGIIEKIKSSKYGGGKYRTAAEYILKI